LARRPGLDGRKILTRISNKWKMWTELIRITTELIAACCREQDGERFGSINGGESLQLWRDCLDRLCCIKIFYWGHAKKSHGSTHSHNSLQMLRFLFPGHFRIFPTTFPIILSQKCWLKPQLVTRAWGWLIFARQLEGNTTKNVAYSIKSSSTRRVSVASVHYNTRPQAWCDSHQTHMAVQGTPISRHDFPTSSKTVTQCPIYTSTFSTTHTAKSHRTYTPTYQDTWITSHSTQRTFCYRFFNKRPKP
jgi:hypothetical protein